MSTHVVLNLLNKLGEKIKCEACRAFHLFFRNEFNKFKLYRSTTVRLHLSYDHDDLKFT